MTSDSVRVWDPFVRVAHWSLAATMVVAWLSGDELEDLHEVAGYVALGIVALRIIWGFIGSRHARFANFLTSPGTALAYGRDLMHGQEKHYLGHNPLGAWMILALILTIAGLSATGWMMESDMFWGMEWIEEVHEGLANFILVLVGLHVAGVIFTGMCEGQNLIRAMITGRKRQETTL